MCTTWLAMDSISSPYDSLGMLRVTCAPSRATTSSSGSILCSPSLSLTGTTILLTMMMVNDSSRTSAAGRVDQRG